MPPSVPQCGFYFTATRSVDSHCCCPSKPCLALSPSGQDSAPPLILETFVHLPPAHLPSAHIEQPCLSQVLGHLWSTACALSSLGRQQTGVTKPEAWICIWVSHAGCQGTKDLGVHLLPLTLRVSRNVRLKAVPGLEPRHLGSLSMCASQVGSRDLPQTPAPLWVLFKLQ